MKRSSISTNMVDPMQLPSLTKYEASPNVQ